MCAIWEPVGYSESKSDKNLPCSNCKELKALKIINEKGVDIIDLRLSSFSIYNQHRSLEGYHCLTKEEYDLLREVFNSFYGNNHL